MISQLPHVVSPAAGAAVRRRILPALLLSLGVPALAGAQPFDLTGTRAQGMAGAFVAVADDASATWWNPAGLPNSFIVDAVIDFQSSQFTDRRETPIPEQEPALRTGAAGVAFAFPALGVSYYRVRQSAVVPATGAADPGRQDPGTAQSARSLLTHQVGLSVAQSLGDALTIGATARLVRGRVGVARFPSAVGPDAALDAVADADSHGTTKADLDVGALLRVSRIRIGLAARNLAAPEFTAPDGSPWQVERAVRVGAAFVSEAARAGRQSWVVALDADLTTTTTTAGDRRDVALGAERWFHERRVGVRGGLRASTAGEARPSASAGASVALAGGVWIEAEGTGGGESTTRGWGVSAHVMF